MSASPTHPIAIAVHGGAGTMRKGSLTAAAERQYTGVLEQSLQAGHDVLRREGTGIQAVTEAIKVLEDSPLFNAGLGAVYTSARTHELDAAIMDGSHRRAGAVAGVTCVRNPIELARRVMEDGRHVLLVGDGAERFARRHGLEIVSNDFFDTQQRLESFHQVSLRQHAIDRGESVGPLTEDQKHGTVGCVALDCNGNLAAATSTGGMTCKHPGRVGDSSLIGCGTYADNSSCAVSATGHGEYFIRWVVAHEVASLMKYANKTLELAGNEVIHEQLKSAGGSGGLIAIDREGSIAMPFNTEGMYRGCIDVQAKMSVAIYR